MFEHLRRTSAAARVAEEVLYEEVALELARGERRLGLWAKALSDAEGDVVKAEGVYIRYRVQAMKDEAALRPTQAPSTSHAMPDARPPVAQNEPSQTLPDDPSMLVDLLCEALSSSKRDELVSQIVGRLVGQGFDRETVELLVRDRLGSQGSLLLSERAWK